ncbi:MAG: phosphatidate cytidylyltransferase [Elusimicrobia bacterium]|nr:phosphatidate cytidylyltransferase [Elusimicrobiota bacterium]
MLLPRVLTAVVGIPVVIGAIHLGGLVYAVFMAGITLLCLYEYGLILWLGGKPVQRVPLAVLGAAMWLAAVLSRQSCAAGMPDGILPMAVTFTVFGVALWELLFPGRSLERMALTLFGIFFVPWTLAYMVNIRELPLGEYYTVMLFVSVWVGDTAAYFAGKRWGKAKLLEAVSPKKTWVGAIAGFIGAVITTIALKNMLIPQSMGGLEAAFLGAVAGVAGQASDLAESVLKRSSGVKDSSALLPGHGGVLDRFDSYLLLAPLYYFALLGVSTLNR